MALQHSGLENHRQQMSLVELPANALRVSRLDFLPQTHLSYIPPGRVTVAEFLRDDVRECFDFHRQKYILMDKCIFFLPLFSSSTFFT
jgi:hypothetical protein